ncbi:Ubiquitin-like-conjugating enzyme Atg3-Atg10 [Babesia duncani]|uniref:Ubiquitin-like-conjugating enzyme Atg3-Atg10 n=1 Tax=Babesia duncani TaxID=323732 RepID=A0AAD9UMV9_9APIC|nr:Ubiquitin-like-conjugating enzyme Atg3-Atg10 [Babesia duncani]
MVDYFPQDKQYLLCTGIKCIPVPNTKLIPLENDWHTFDYHKENEKTREKSDNQDPAELPHAYYRTYDASVTYDRFYETPRIWLQGYNMVGLPLTNYEMLMDVPPFYLGKTITVERHPFTGLPNLTIHPCYQLDAIVKQNKDSENFWWVLKHVLYHY